MKTLFNKKMALKLIFASLFFSSILLGCKRNDMKPTEIAASDGNVNIKTLKIYLSQLTGKDISGINYNSVSKMFSINGVDQLSKEKLEELLKSNPVHHYKDGVPTLQN
jgi:predicted transcriptional regulator